MINQPKIEIGQVSFLLIADVVQLLKDKLREAISDSVMIGKDEGRFDCPRFEQIWVIAHLPELHEHTHDAEEVCLC